MIESTTIPVWVTSVDYRGGAVAFGRGETEDGGRVDFAGEPRALWAISEALAAGDGPVLAAIPTWWSITHRPSRARRPPRVLPQRAATAAGGTEKARSRRAAPLAAAPASPRRCSAI